MKIYENLWTSCEPHEIAYNAKEHLDNKINVYILSNIWLKYIENIDKEVWKSKKNQ